MSEETAEKETIQEEEKGSWRAVVFILLLVLFIALIIIGGYTLLDYIRLYNSVQGTFFEGLFPTTSLITAIATYLTTILVLILLLAVIHWLNVDEESTKDLKNQILELKEKLKE